MKRFSLGVKKGLQSEDGSTIVLTLLILVLLAAFVALAVTRSVSETLSTANDVAETRAFTAAEASLETMTREFDKVFEEKLSPDLVDLQRIRNTVPPGFEDYNFQQEVVQTRSARVVDLTGSFLKGLKALRDEWRFQTTTTDRNSGVQVVLRRWIYNNRIPLFQFGIFYNDDAEFHPGPLFNFGGRVHSNGNIFLMASSGLYFSSIVTASREIITDVARNGSPWNHWSDKVYIRDATGIYRQLRYCMGSVITTSYGSDCGASASTPVNLGSGYPTLYRNENWPTYRNLFQGNLLSGQPRLDLPLVIASHGGLSYIELIKRGKNIGDLHNLNGAIVPVNSSTADSFITTKERYANKNGIRITLADRKEMLPGCADPATGNAVSTPCGVRLDGDPSGNGDDVSNPERAGYLPKPMADGYQATRVNGYRLRTGGTTINGRQRQVWIKVELVRISPVTGQVETQDVTEHILSLGVTERPAFAGMIQGYGNADSRSIIKLQRFSMPEGQLTASDNTYYTFLPSVSPAIPNPGMAINQNIVALRYSTNNGSTWAGLDTGYSPPDDPVHRKRLNLPLGNTVTNLEIVPFPIKMFDTREGLFNDSLTNTQLNSLYPNGTVPWAGVMSMIDIDIANLRRFLNGEFDSAMPTINGRRIRSTDVPEANGWVLYVSDRRGDRDFDGQYDMENIYVPTNNPTSITMEPGEDVNDNGVLDVDYGGEAPRYTDYDNRFPYCAFFDHSYYRRGVRLINGTVLPGRYDATNPANTKGFTVASENAVYVLGNYNATGVDRTGLSSTDVTPSTRYLPQNTPEHIPASIVADAVIILSNNWQDSRSFRYPFSLSNRPATETTVRFAMLAGDPRSSLNGNPNQGGGDPRLAGGIHNFKRFLEYWGGNAAPLHYTGSLINLYNAQVNNGSFKCCSKVYSPPQRDWTFDISLLDPTRLPPGTPFIHNIQLTGFQRVN